MVGQVSSLMKTVKNVEDEAARGVQSLEATIDNIESDLKVCIDKHNISTCTCLYRMSHMYLKSAVSLVDKSLTSNTHFSLACLAFQLSTFCGPGFHSHWNWRHH